MLGSLGWAPAFLVWTRKRHFAPDSLLDSLNLWLILIGQDTMADEEVNGYQRTVRIELGIC